MPADLYFRYFETYELLELLDLSMMSVLHHSTQISVIKEKMQVYCKVITSSR